MSRTSQPTEVIEEYDADKEFGAAIKALQEAAWHMRLGSYALMERAQVVPSLVNDVACALSESVGFADALADQIETIGTLTRRLRKRAKSI